MQIQNGGAVVKAEEVKIYREVQKSTQMAIKAIETISDKVYDDGLAMQIARQSLKYSDLSGRATDQLLKAKAEPYHANRLADMALTGSIHVRTLLDTSTSHIADLMIQGSNRGITQMCRVLNHNPGVGTKAVEFAKELMDFEEKNIERLKKYL